MSSYRYCKNCKHLELNNVDIAAQRLTGDIHYLIRYECKYHKKCLFYDTDTLSNINIFREAAINGERKTCKFEAL